MWVVHLPFPGHCGSVTHCQCDARPTVTFSATERHRRLASTKLYCLVTEAYVCEPLAQGRYMKVEQWSGTHDRKSNHASSISMQRSFSTAAPSPLLSQTCLRLRSSGSWGNFATPGASFSSGSMSNDRRLFRSDSIITPSASNSLRAFFWM